MERAVYAGLLVRAERVEVSFGEYRYQSESQYATGADHGLRPARDLPDGSWPISVGKARSAITDAAEHIVAMCPEVRGVGIASYGPLLSVNENDLASSERRERYGTVSGRTVHVPLRGERVYSIVNDVLMQAKLRGTRLRRGLNVPVDLKIHTDVMCGALFEASERRRPIIDPEQQKYRRLMGNNGLLFIHVDSGIGGAYVVGTRPFESGLHPEIGYTCPQLMKDDDFGQSKPAPVWLEHLATTTSICDRAGTEKISEIPQRHDAWRFAAEYIGQTIVNLTLSLAPHQVVVHGAPFEERVKQIRFLERVREGFSHWLPNIVEYDETKERDVFIDVPMVKNPMLCGAIVLAALDNTQRLSGVISGDDILEKVIRGRPR